MTEELFKSKYDKVSQSMINQDNDISLFVELFNQCDNSYEKEQLMLLMIETSSILAFEFLIKHSYEIPYIIRKKSIIHKIQKNIYNFCRKNKKNYILLVRKMDFLSFVKNHFKDESKTGDEDQYNLDSIFLSKYKDIVNSAKKYKIIITEL